MNSGLFYLNVFGAFVIVVMLVQVLAAMQQLGLSALAGNREDLTLSGFAGRIERALNNSLIALVMIAPAVLALHFAGFASASTELAVQIFLVARIAYVVVYSLGIPWLRTGVWLVGFLCTAFLYSAALKIPIA